MTNRVVYCINVMFLLFGYLFLFFLDVIVFMTLFVGLHLCLTIAEMVLMKVIYILRFSMIAIMDENFITTILNMFNMVFISILVISGPGGSVEHREGREIINPMSTKYLLYSLQRRFPG